MSDGRGGSGEVDAFLDLVAELVLDLPDALVERVALGLERLDAAAGIAERRAVARGVTQPGARPVVERLLASWEPLAAAVSPQAVAWALRGASRAEARSRLRQSAELVWTGPVPRGTGLRRTDEVLLGLIEEARASLLVVSFAVHAVPEVRRALAAALDRGVKTTLLLESERHGEGSVRGEPIDALGVDLARRSRVLVWPAAQRQRDERGRCGALHAKCAVADEEALLASSANITGHALRLNMELGVLVRGGDLPRRVALHFEQLLREGYLVSESD